MSIGLEIWLVDYDKIQAAYGSNERELFQAIMDSTDFELEDNSVTRDPQYQDQEWAEDGPLYKDMLNEFLAGRVSVDKVREHRDRYVRILHELCRHFGTLQPAKMFENLPPSKYSRALDAFFHKRGINSQIHQTGILHFETDPLGFELGGDDLNYSFLSNKTVKIFLQKLEPLNLMGIPNDVAAGIITVYSWLKAAEKSNQGLMIYCG
jgi:hypothetical protein